MSVTSIEMINIYDAARQGYVDVVIGILDSSNNIAYNIDRIAVIGIERGDTGLVIEMMSRGISDMNYVISEAIRHNKTDILEILLTI